MSTIATHLQEFFAQMQPRVDALLRDLIAPESKPIANLDDATAYALGLDEGGRSGKRIRPLLCLMTCRDLGGDVAAAMPFAAAIELMHNFCLVHDDIEDGDEYRRGRAAVWKRFGLAHGVNAGDYLFTKIYAAILRGADMISPEKTMALISLMNETLDHTHRGQAMDINARNATISVEEYLVLVREKTGYYFAAPLTAGAIVADADEQTRDSLLAFGMAAGALFQIRDDLIDLTDGKGRQSRGSDIREGKRSFLVAWSLEHLPQWQREQLLRILGLERTRTSDDDVQQAIQLFESSGAVAHAERTCQELRQQANELLHSLPEPLSDNLAEVLSYLTQRTS